MLVAALAGCGGTAGEDRPDQSAALLLDGKPNAVHAGIYSAVRRGYDEAEGVHLRVRVPASEADPAKMLLTGRTQFAVLDLHDLALARQAGRDVVAVMALVQQPLPAAFRKRTRGARVYRVGDRGAPAYPELVLVATRQTIDDEPALVRATVRALIRGYALTLSDPASSVQDEVAASPGLDEAALTRQIDVLDTAFLGASGRFGTLDIPRLRAWARWEARFGIVRRPPDVARMFDPSFADAGDGSSVS